MISQLRCGIASKFVRSQFNRNAFLAFQQLPEEALGGALVLAVLQEDVQYVAILVDGTPEILALALNRHGDLIKKPTIATRSASLSEAPRVVEAKRGAPLPDRFVRHDDIALGQQVFDVAQAQGKPVVEPDRVADDLGRKPLAAIVRWTAHRHIVGDRPAS